MQAMTNAVTKLVIVKVSINLIARLFISQSLSVKKHCFFKELYLYSNDWPDPTR